MRCAVLLIFALSACVDLGPEGRSVLGSPADVTTEPGEHATYRVITDCATGVDYGVIGTGSMTLTTNDDIASAGTDLYEQLQTIPSVWHGGDATPVCTSDVVGTKIYVDDWRDVDTVIAMTGEWLHARNLTLEVAISVDTPAVPHGAK